MTASRRTAITFFAGTAGLLLTMALHPTTTASITPDQLARLAGLSADAHALAMLSLLTLVLGAIGLTRLIGGPAAFVQPVSLAFAALVFYVAAVFAFLIATTVSGFLMPTLLSHMLHDAAYAAPMWHVTLDAIFQMNQAFSRLATVAISIAIVLWSAAGLRNGSLGRGMALYGCIAAPVLVLATIFGHLRPDVHGMAATVLVQGVWFVLVAVQLYREPETV